jgi:hypothetical protein
MNDYERLIDLLDRSGMYHHETELYKSDGSNELAGTAIWLTVGHFEFDENGKLTNTVNY